jgi:integrase
MQPFHALRHAAASYMLASGVDLRVVMEVLGHSQIHVTANTYGHIRTETTRLAAEAVNALLAR